MSSENQQNPSQENEKARKRLQESISTFLWAFVSVLLAFTITTMIYAEDYSLKNLKLLLEDKYILYVILFLLVPITLIICLICRLKKSRRIISSNLIFNFLILSLLISACSFSKLVEITDDKIKDIATKNINNIEIKTDIKEKQTQNNQKNTQKIENNKSNEDNKHQGSNQNNENTSITLEDKKFFVTLLSILGTAFLYFLSGYLFVLKGKVEDYLDYIDEQNS